MTLSSYERQLAELATTPHFTQLSLRTAETQISELEKDRRYLVKREEDEKAGREAEKQDWEAERGSLNAEAARRRVSELEVALADLQDEYSTSNEAHPSLHPSTPHHFLLSSQTLTPALNLSLPLSTHKLSQKRSRGLMSNWTKKCTC
jgi:hypothetical protein